MHFIKVRHLQSSEKPFVLSESEFVNYLLGLSSVCNFRLSFSSLYGEDHDEENSNLLDPDVSCLIIKCD